MADPLNLVFDSVYIRNAGFVMTTLEKVVASVPLRGSTSFLQSICLRSWMVAQRTIRRKSGHPAMLAMLGPPRVVCHRFVYCARELTE